MGETRPHGAERLLDGSRDELDRHIACTADRGYGVLRRAWLLDVGLSPREIATRLRRRWLRETAFDGVYVLGHLAFVPGQREALALAGSGPESALASATSGRWQHLVDVRRSGPIHVIVPKSRAAPVPGLVRSAADLPAADVWVVGGLRCTTPERTTMDLPTPLLRQALQELMRRDIAIEPLVERMRGRRNAVAFRDEAAQLVPQLAHTMSELEARYVRLCRRHGFELPVVNGTLAGGDLLDCTWPGRRLVVELDGRRWHVHRDREDRRRDRERSLDGWVPIRFDWWDVTRFEQRTAMDTARGLRL